MALYHAALAVAAGMAAQAVALRFALPSIVLLLAVGVVIGPDVLSMLDPKIFGSARIDLVSLAVTIILFEGGLGLRREDLRQHRRILVMLLTVGAGVSAAVAAVAAHQILGMPWQTALLYGALMIVTGPTVVTPLLARLTVERSVREILVSEGVLIDPVGAIVAIVGLEYVLGAHGAVEMGWLLIGRLVLGAAIGAAAGVALAAILRLGWIHEDLWNPVVLAVVLLTAAVASRLSPEAGLMTAVTQGVVMANVGLRELRRLRQFNEEVTVVLLSFVFVLLAADLPLHQVWALGWRALVVVAVVVWVGRPLAIALCATGSELTARQRLFLSWVCPRGVVAASVAGLFRILLEDAEVGGGEALEALVFVTVALTVCVQGLTIRPVARALKVDLPTLQGTVIVGATRFGRMLARLLVASGRQVVLLDRNRLLCAAAQAEGFSVYRGDALAIDDLEDAGARYVDTVAVITANGELNTLVAHRIRDNFRVHRILWVADEATRELKGREPFPGNFPGPEEADRLLGARRLRVVVYEAGESVEAGRPLGELPYAEGEFALLLGRRDRIFVASGDQTLIKGDRLFCASAGGQVSPLGALMARGQEFDPEDMRLSRGEE